MAVPLAAVVAILATGAAFAASGSIRSARSAATTVKATVLDFRIDVPAVLHAGPTRFVVTDSGSAMHEFNIARTDLAPKDLPLAADGNVEDKAPRVGFTHLGEVEGIDIGQHKTLTLTLRPGRYVVYCNMDGHYAAGMTEQIRVVA